MAKVIKNRSHMKNDILFTNFRMIFQGIKFLALAVLFIYILILQGRNRFINSYMIMIYGIYTIYRIIYLSKKKNILKQCIEGEKNFLKLAERLPKNYKVIHNLNLNYDGKKSKVDVVVVGDSGVFVIDIKNVTGTIKGNVYDEDLIQIKKTKEGDEFENKMFNPLPEVNSNSEKICAFLKENHIYINVQSMVVFVDDNVNLDLNGTCPTAYFEINDSKENLFINYITNYNTDVHLSKYDKKNIVSLLCN
ncbi:nuclease-related domain-containing protein [Clostridium hydrogeniformans]|uniref:nuclease-related domain-containing protein n=1 Tax=Clostridium hydrogeniformans TaxID=349933 RepID=UPI00068C9A71|nr:nuclease-related domain-containing protein [Clostridium hydrogeniformans]